MGKFGEERTREQQGRTPPSKTCRMVNAGQDKGTISTGIVATGKELSECASASEALSEIDSADIGEERLDTWNSDVDGVAEECNYDEAKKERTTRDAKSTEKNSAIEGVAYEQSEHVQVGVQSMQTAGAYDRAPGRSSIRRPDLNRLDNRGPAENRTPQLLPTELNLVVENEVSRSLNAAESRTNVGSNNSRLPQATCLGNTSDMLTTHSAKLILEDDNDRQAKLRESERRKSMLQWAVLGTLLLLLVVGAAVGITVGVKSSNSSSVREDSQIEVGQTNTTSTAPPTRTYILDIPNRTITTIEKNPDSAQAKAYDWLVQDFALQEHPGDKLRQRFALATLYYSTGGNQWTVRGSSTGDTDEDEWLSGSDECAWWTNEPKFKPPVCQNGTLRVLSLHSNNLVGEIPAELALLTDLHSVVGLEKNNLQGSLPVEIFQSLSMPRGGLLLGGNSISGPIPTEIGEFKVRFLLLENNRLTSMPTELGMMQGLQYLDLHDNLISGSKIVSELASLGSLKVLNLSRNRFVGSIMTEIGSMSNLNELWASRNRLSGQMPSELGLLIGSEVWLPDFLCDKPPDGEPAAGPGESRPPGGDLTGLVGPGIGPAGLGPGFGPGLGPNPGCGFRDMPNGPGLRRLELDNNAISGSLPSEFGRLRYLERLYLQENDIVGSIPSELGLLLNLTHVDLSGNARLTGTLPRGWWSSVSTNITNTSTSTSSRLEFLSVKRTNISGTIHASMCGVVAFDCSARLCGCDCNCTV